MVGEFGSSIPSQKLYHLICIGAGFFLVDENILGKEL